MNTKDLIQVMREHTNKTQVTVQKVKDCTEFWDDLTTFVYDSFPITDELDRKTRQTMLDFAEGDDLTIVNRKGKILKRFSAFFKQQNGFKLEDKYLGIIGDRMQFYISKDAADYILDFTDNFDWSDGYFGKSGSCWWGTYASSLPTFQDGGGWAVRFYNDESDTRGIGRTWIYPSDSVLVCFNSYGIERPNVSKAIKQIFSQHGITLHYKKVEVYNSNNSEIPYVNGDTGFILYPEPMTDEDVNNLLSSNGFDLDLVVQEDDRITCDNCGNRIDEGDGYYVDDRDYCESCLSRLFSYCECCEEYCNNDEVKEAVDSRWNYICKYCAERKGLTLCSECDKYCDEYITTDEDNDLCNKCAEGVFYCEKCEVFCESGECDNCTDDIPNTETTLEAVLFRNYNTNTTDLKNLIITRVQNVSGLYVFNLNQFEESGWSVTHEISSVRIVRMKTKSQAIKFMLEIAELTNWNVPKDELQNNEALLYQVREMTNRYYEYIIR